jgi:hypothetical protein
MEITLILITEAPIQISNINPGNGVVLFTGQMPH